MHSPSADGLAKRWLVKKRLKIASWNINSVRARIALVERLIAEQQPDILCLQETKVVDDIFPADLFLRQGYVHHELNGQRMHHGVAILSRVPLKDPGKHDWQDNGEARHVGVRLECGIRLENVYVPAGGDTPDRAVNPKFGQKLDFLERMTRWSESLAEPTIILGDFNVAPLECDVWSHKALVNVVSHTPVEVEALGRLQEAHGWIDIGRRFVPAPARNFTCWC
jgi:exodeoxyribonuclease-3